MIVEHFARCVAFSKSTPKQARLVIRAVALFAFTKDAKLCRDCVAAIPGSPFSYRNDILPLKRNIEYSTMPDHLGKAVLSVIDTGETGTDEVDERDVSIVMECLTDDDIVALREIAGDSSAEVDGVDQFVDDIVKTSKSASRMLRFVSRYDVAQSQTDIEAFLSMEGLRIYNVYKTKMSGQKLRNFIKRGIWNSAKGMIQHNTRKCRGRVVSVSSGEREYMSTLISLDAAISEDGGSTLHDYLR